jgi:hypothetical protein
MPGGGPVSAARGGGGQPDKKAEPTGTARRGWKFDWFRQVRPSRDLSPSAKLVASAIVFDHASENGSFRVSLRQLGDEIGAGEKTAQRAIKELIRYQFVRRTPEPGDPNKCRIIPADTRVRMWLSEEEGFLGELQDWLAAEKRHDDRQRVQRDQWITHEGAHLRGELLKLADNNGIGRGRQEAWVQKLVADALAQIKDAAAGGRTLPEHPLRVPLRLTPEDAYAEAMSYYYYRIIEAA